jgi:SAM-dependent methyltransferase
MVYASDLKSDDESHVGSSPTTRTIFYKESIMSHPAQMSFVDSVKNMYPNNFKNIKVLEVGSMDINGTVRVFFENCDYIGLDIAEGKCVDFVCEGNNYNAPDNTFDTVISCECFEHNKFWKETFQNMHRMCKASGLVVMTCASSGRPEHGTSRTTKFESATSRYDGWEDYYMNLTEEDFMKNFNIVDMFSHFKFIFNSSARDLYFYGIKK